MTKFVQIQLGSLEWKNQKCCTSLKNQFMKRLIKDWYWERKEEDEAQVLTDDLLIARLALDRCATTSGSWLSLVEKTIEIDPYDFSREENGMKDV